jgi:hypothetical protein
MNTNIIAQTEPAVTANPGLFPTLHLDNFKAMELCFAILLALATNRRRQRTFAPTRLREVIWALREALKNDPLMDEIAAYYGGQVDRHALLVRVQISFWSNVLNLPVEQVCQWASTPAPASLARAMGQRAVCYPQRIAELHTRLGPDLRSRLYARGKAILYRQPELARLTENDLTRAVEAQTFEPPALEMGRMYGFSYFVNFVFRQGVFAQLEPAPAQALNPNGYSLRELLAAYFRRFDTQAATPDALAEELRTGYWTPGADQTITPVSQTMRNFLAKLIPEQVILVQEAQARRTLNRLLKTKGWRTRLRVAVDATLLRLFGRFEDMERLFDHVTQQSIMGYKLYVVFELTTRQPIAFVLHEPKATRPDEQPKGDADYLDALIRKVKGLPGVKHLEYILFDKGFWSQAAFKRLVEAGEAVVTPGKKFKTIQDAVAAISRSRWVRAARNQRVADTTVTFDNGLTLRLVVWKSLGKKVVRDAQGKPKKDKAGNTLYQPAPIYYTYVTNLSPDEVDPAQVVGLYGQRWGIEDFFEQMDNQYHWACFPGTDLALVKVHIALTFLGYTLLTEFRRLVAQWLDNAEYATMELRRFARLFLRAPITWLRWLKHRQPGQRRPRWRHRYLDFMSGLAAFGEATASPELL